MKLYMVSELSILFLQPPANGHCVDSTHPTRMHSCFQNESEGV